MVQVRWSRELAIMLIKLRKCESGRPLASATSHLSQTIAAQTPDFAVKVIHVVPLSSFLPYFTFARRFPLIHPKTRSPSPTYVWIRASHASRSKRRLTRDAHCRRPTRMGAARLNPDVCTMTKSSASAKLSHSIKSSTFNVQF